MLKQRYWNKVAKQLYWNRTSSWVFSCNFAAYFLNTFSWERMWEAASVYYSSLWFFLLKDLLKVFPTLFWERWSMQQIILSDRLFSFNDTVGIKPFETKPSRNSPPDLFFRKRCSEYMQQIYRRTNMPKCDFNKVALQLY